jgi:hypothetical protein
MRNETMVRIYSIGVRPDVRVNCLNFPPHGVLATHTPGLLENSRPYLPGEIIPDDFHLSRCYFRSTRKSELLSFLSEVTHG